MSSAELSAAELRTLEQTCVAAAEAGAAVLRDLFEQPRDVQFKGRIDLVTDADRASEERVLRVLAERAPGVAILAEESGAHAATGSPGAALRFIVDPLDGTTNYAHGIPLFTCTVAVERAGVPVAGCTVDPIRGERFRAAAGLGAFRGFVAEAGRGTGEGRLAVSRCAAINDAVVCTGFAYDKREQLPAMLDAFARFTHQARGTRRLGSAALDLAYVAAGRLDGFWEQGLKAWDVAAGDLLVREAGGRVTRFDGAELTLSGGEILAAGPGLHALMQDQLAQVLHT